MKYEYKVFTLCLKGTDEMKDAELTRVLNQFGSYGWELVTVDNTLGECYYHVYLKRVIMEGKTL